MGSHIRECRNPKCVCSFIADRNEHYCSKECKVIEDTTFIFTQEMMETALKANGWHEWYGKTWRRDTQQSDMGVSTLKQAFGSLLRENNIA